MKRFQEFYRFVSSKRISIYAANASFFVLLSFFPMLMLLTGLLRYTSVSPVRLYAILQRTLPAPFLPLLQDSTAEALFLSSPALVSLSALTALWSSSRGVYSLMRGLNGVYSLRESRSYLRRRLICIFYTLLLLFALLLTLLLYVFGQHLQALLQGSALPISRLLLFLIRLRWPVIGVLLTGLFVLILAVFPNRKLSVKKVFPGAVLSAVGWQVYTTGFTFYVAHSGASSRLYGSLSSIAIAMLWLYACLSILFYGALLNYALDSRRQMLHRLLRPSGRAAE